MSAYTQWVASGRSFTLAYPVADLVAVLRKYGYEVGTIGDTGHLTANPPEDHTPYSATGWPFPAPSGWVFALDIMPGGAIDLAALGAQLAADKTNGLPDAAAIKYMNWQPKGHGCRHESWEPGHLITDSSDVGHIHVSMRTDYQSSHAMAGYDPVARARTGAATVAAPPPAGQAPPWPRRVLVYRPGVPMMHGTDVTQAQQRLVTRGWHLGVDGWYGSQTAGVVSAFQADCTNHGWPLTVDGELGPKTWEALWRRPVS